MQRDGMAARVRELEAAAAEQPAQAQRAAALERALADASARCEAAEAARARLQRPREELATSLLVRRFPDALHTLARQDLVLSGTVAQTRAVADPASWASPACAAVRLQAEGAGKFPRWSPDPNLHPFPRSAPAPAAVDEGPAAAGGAAAGGRRRGRAGRRRGGRSRRARGAAGGAGRGGRRGCARACARCGRRRGRYGPVPGRMRAAAAARWPGMQAQSRPTVCLKLALSCSLRSQLQHFRCRACVTPQRQGAGVNQLGADLAGYPVCDS